jgi:class 3 adenylate cyclase
LVTKNQFQAIGPNAFVNTFAVAQTTDNPAVFIGYYNFTSVSGTNISSLAKFMWASDTSLYHNGSLFIVNSSVVDGTYEMAYIQSFRLAELMIRTSPPDLSTLTPGSHFSMAIFSNRRNVIVDSAISIGRTTCLILIFLLTIYFYYNDSKKLLLGPFADMLKKIRKIEENPMTAAREMQLENDELEKKARFDSSLRRELEELRKYETNILTNTLAKSGQLLALGFGEAGINIILEKLTKGSEMVGKKVICLFGFADIKMFTEVSERLKENVINFVNEIAEVVSPIIDKFTGGTNKNLGEAFLFVWKFREEDTISMYDYDAEGNLHKNVKLKEYADKNNPITDRCDVAVLSFLECIIHVYKSPTLQKYKYEKRLKDLHDFRVKNSFGLHIGWAIEGAIGSEYKIDASYLSPNVNLASRVQYATKQFGVYILVSGMVYDLLSKEIQALMREIDCVELKGSKLAMHLWTYDMDLSVLAPALGEHVLNEERTKIYERLRKEKMIQYRRELKNFHEQFYQGRISGKTMFLSQKDVINVHRRFPKRFYDEWNTGYGLYIAGNWEAARPHFEETKNMIPGYEDKPSTVILGFLEAANYKAPGYWKGVRHLTSK